MIRNAFQLASERLIIRPMQDTDADALSFEHMICDWENSPLPDRISGQARVVYAGVLGSDFASDNLRVGAFLKDVPDKIVTSVLFEHRQYLYPPVWELDVQTIRAYRGQGYMYETLSTLLPFAKTRGMKSIWSVVAPQNQASLKMVRRLGMRRVGQDDRGIHFRYYRPRVSS